LPTVGSLQLGAAFLTNLATQSENLKSHQIISKNNCHFNK
jgi:hypothetical protein